MVYWVQLLKLTVLSVISQIIKLQINTGFPERRFFILRKIEAEHALEAYFSKIKENDVKKTNLKKAGVAAGALCFMLAVGGVMAYFTDKDEKTNFFSVGEVAIDLREERWDRLPDNNNNDVPDEAENMVPGKTIDKDPQVTNVGSNAAYIFLTVNIPCQELQTVNQDGTKNERKMTDLFFYETYLCWKHLGECMTTDTVGRDSRKHLYAYVDKEGKCQSVKPEEVTKPLFEKISMVNLMEGEGLEKQPFDVQIEAYAIQSECLPDETKDAGEIWKIITNQRELPDKYESGEE